MMAPRKYRKVKSVLRPYIKCKPLPLFSDWWLDEDVENNESCFLYQVFPGNTIQWQRLFFKSIRNGDFVVVSKMINFFKTSHPEFINSKESNTGNTVLHSAAKYGHFDICKFLLESGCNVNARNSSGCTPLFMAAEGLHKRCVQLMIEWGCNVKIQNFKCQVGLDLMRHDEMRAQMEEISRYWLVAVTEIVDGAVDRLHQVVKDHVLKVQEMADPAARCLHGSTLVHTAAHFSQLETLKDLIKIRVDVNCRDYQGATPLHRAKDKRTIQLLLESNADINPTDNEGNTPLHVLSYGNDQTANSLNGVLQLIRSGVDQFIRNSRKLLPIHCAAMKGNRDIIEVFLNHSEDLLKAEIDKESKKSPPSLPFLAAIGDYITCAKWLIQKGFEFKGGECDQLFYKLVKEDIDSDNRLTTAKFLLDNGASIKLKYDKGDTIIHLATQMSGSSDVFQLLLEYGADIDLTNDENASPLFYAAKLNKFENASILIQKGADIRRKNVNGLSAFDFIHDFQEWISCGLFTAEIVARLKAYELKHARNLIKGISKKIKTESIRQKIIINEAFKQKIDKNISNEIFAHFRKQLKTGNTARNIITMQRPRFLSHSLPSLPSTAARATRTPLPVTPSGQPAMVVKITRSLALPPVTGI